MKVIDQRVLVEHQRGSGAASAILGTLPEQRVIIGYVD
jgi:hypothetical protein